MAEDSALEWAKFAASAITAVTATVGGAVALRNWRDTSRWKRAELGASYLQPFFADDEVTFALRCIDWAVGKIPVPKKYEKMMGVDTIDHEPALLIMAIEPMLNAEVLSNDKGMLYRLTLDVLFTRIDWIAYRVESKIIRVEDVRDLEYWLEKLKCWPYVPKSLKGRIKPEQVFMPFLRKLYPKVVWLMDEFKNAGR